MTLSDQLDKIKEQEWYQQIKSSYDQLSLEQQQYVKWGAFSFLVIILLYITFVTVDLANTAKNDYFDEQELAGVVSQASDEIRRLKGQNAGFTQTGAQNWKTIFQALAAQIGLPADGLEVTKESPGASQNIIQETLLEVNVKGIIPKQLTQLLYGVEHGNPPMKLKGMKTTTNPDDGTVNATLNISGYLPKPEKGEKSK